MKKLISAIGNLFSKLFAGIIGQARRYGKPGVLVVQLLKEVVMSGAALDLTKRTRTDLDDRFLAKARILLPEVFNIMQITNDCVTIGKTNDEIIQCGLEKIKLFHPDYQDSVWLNIAAHLSAGFSDGKYKFSEMVALVWLIYHQEVKG